jgi:hypothetical protein
MTLKIGVWYEAGAFNAYTELFQFVATHMNKFLLRNRNGYRPPMANFGSTMVLGLIVGLMVVPQLLMAQRNPDRPPIEDLLPETTVGFFQIADFRDAVQKWKDGAAGAMYEDKEIQPLVDRMVEEGRKAYGKVEDTVGLSLEEIQSLPSGEMVVAVIAPRRKNPEFMMIVEVGEENEAVDKALGRAREAIAETGTELEETELESGLKVEKVVIDENTVFIAQQDGLMIASTSEKELENFFARWAGETVKKVRPLSSNRKFITVMNRCRSKKELPAEVRFFVDPIGIFKSAGRGNMGMQAAIAFLPTLGLDGLLGAGGSMIMGDEDYEFVIHSHLLMASPKKGILKMVAFKPADYEPQEWVPNDIHWYTSTSWDIDQLYNELESMVDTTMGEEGSFAEMIEDNVNENIPITLKEDVLDQLTGRLTLTNVTAEPGRFNGASWIIGAEVKDLDKARETVEKMVEFANEQENVDGSIEAMTYEGVTYWAANQDWTEERNEARAERRRERNERRGRPDVEMNIRMPYPTLSFIGDSLVFTDSVEAFHKAVDTYKGTSETLRNSDEFVEMSREMTNLLGTDMPVALSYNQPKYQFQMLLDMASSEDTKTFLSTQAENNEFFSVVKGVMDDHPLPSMDTLNKYMMPSGWFATSDDTGYHLLWFQKRYQR